MIANGIANSNALGNYMDGQRQEKYDKLALGDAQFNLDEKKSKARQQKALEGASARISQSLIGEGLDQSAAVKTALGTAPSTTQKSTAPGVVPAPEIKASGEATNGGLPATSSAEVAPGQTAQAPTALGEEEAPEAGQEEDMEGFLPGTVQKLDGGSSKAAPSKASATTPPSKGAPKIAGPTGAGKPTATPGAALGSAQPLPGGAAPKGPTTEAVGRNAHMVLSAAQTRYQAVQAFSMNEFDKINKKYPQGSEEWINETNAVASQMLRVRAAAEEELVAAHNQKLQYDMVSAANEVGKYVYSKGIQKGDNTLKQMFQKVGIDPAIVDQVKVERDPMGFERYFVPGNPEPITPEMIMALASNDFTGAANAASKMRKMIVDGAQKVREENNKLAVQASKMQIEREKMASRERVKSLGGGGKLNPLEKEKMLIGLQQDEAVIKLLEEGGDKNTELGTLVEQQEKAHRAYSDAYKKHEKEGKGNDHPMVKPLHELAMNLHAPFKVKKYKEEKAKEAETRHRIERTRVHLFSDPGFRAEQKEKLMQERNTQKRKIDNLKLKISASSKRRLPDEERKSIMKQIGEEQKNLDALDKKHGDFRAMDAEDAVNQLMALGQKDKEEEENEPEANGS